MIKSFLIAVVFCASYNVAFGIAGDLCLIDFRGDINASGAVIGIDGTPTGSPPTQDINMSDAVMLSNFLFSGGQQPPSCSEVWDANSDGVVNIVDPTYILNYLFSGGAAPAPDQIECHFSAP